MKKKIIFIVSFVLLICSLLFFSPYNLFHYLNAEKKVANILADSAIREEGLGENSEITNINYLGNHIYRVETEKSTYLIEIKEKDSTRFLEIFEHKQRIIHFHAY